MPAFRRWRSSSTLSPNKFVPPQRSVPIALSFTPASTRMRRAASWLCGMHTSSPRQQRSPTISVCPFTQATVSTIGTSRSLKISFPTWQKFRSALPSSLGPCSWDWNGPYAKCSPLSKARIMDEPQPLIPESFPEGHRSGYVALIGKPNVGKSTLMNAFMGRKLSIVTRKPQTTRHRVLGILSDEHFQAIFLDTPGIIKPRYRLHESMMRAVENAIADADVLVFMADATQDRPDELILDFLRDKSAILAINKMDRIRQEEALPLVESYVRLRSFEEVVPISALTGYNLDVLLRLIVERLPEGPPFYPKDIVSEQPERFFVAEIVREKAFELYRDEIPYSLHVDIVQFEEREDEKDFVSAEII